MFVIWPPNKRLYVSNGKNLASKWRCIEDGSQEEEMYMRKIA